MKESVRIAVDLCKFFEGFRSAPYLCPAGVATIGYGSTYYQDGSKVELSHPPMSMAQAEQLLLFELDHTYFPGVLRQCPNLIFESPGRLAAIVDFAYNLGVGRLQTSTLKRKIISKDWEGVKEQLMLWVRGGGKILPGLVKRRSAEARLI
jgi:lysozyme